MKKLALATILLFACGQGDALYEARKFAQQHYPSHTSVDCISGLSADSDDDGYVSCTIFTPEGPEAIECATNHFGACSSKGCRIATGKGGKRNR